MRRILATTLMLAITMAPTGAARAGATSDPSSPSITSTSATAEAFWYTTRVISPDTVARSVWYVGAFENEDGTASSDLYREVDVCHRGDRRVHCREVAYEVGYTTFTGPGETLTIDSADLTIAHLEGDYELQRYDRHGQPVGDPVPYHAVADWSGVGPIDDTGRTYIFRTGCNVFITHFHDRSRDAISSGTLNGEYLGQTDDTFLGTGSRTTWRHTC